jgi:hypothetical protein
MNSKYFYFICLILLLFSVLLFSVLLDENKIQSRASPAQPSIFAKVVMNEKTIAFFGKDPLIYESNYSTWLYFDGIARSVKDNQALDEYLVVNGGPITGYTGSSSGYIMIFIDPNQKNNLTHDDFKSIREIILNYSQDPNLPIIFYEYQIDDFEGARYRMTGEAVENSSQLNEIIISLKNDEDFQSYLSDYGGPVSECYVSDSFIQFSWKISVKELKSDDFEQISLLIENHAQIFDITNPPIVIHEIYV